MRLFYALVFAVVVPATAHASLDEAVTLDVNVGSSVKETFDLNVAPSHLFEDLRMEVANDDILALEEFDCVCAGGAAFFQGVGAASGYTAGTAVSPFAGPAAPAVPYVGAGVGALAGEGAHQLLMHGDESPSLDARPGGAQMRLME